MSLADYREDQARWVKGSPIHVNEMCFFVRRWGSPEAQQALRDIRRSIFGPSHKHQDIDDDVLMGEWLAEYGVTGWEGVIDESGKELRFTKKNARAVFCNPEYFYSLNRMIFNGAANFENYLHQDAEEDEEELKKS